MPAPQHKNLNPVVELVTASMSSNQSAIATTQAKGGAVFGAACEVLGVTLESTGSGTIDVDVFDVDGVTIASVNTALDAVVTLLGSGAKGPFTVTTTNDSGSSAASIVHIYVRR